MQKSVAKAQNLWLCSILIPFCGSRSRRAVGCGRQRCHGCVQQGRGVVSRDRDGRGIVREGSRRDRDDLRHAERNERGIKADDEAVLDLDAAHQALGQHAHRQQ